MADLYESAMSDAGMEVRDYTRSTNFATGEVTVRCV